uniref:Uncharacterized protein n=1 Tax=Glossina palpalis gambiensis TaxID=67801 RepID=A0A1B0B974_9MUSC
MKLQQSRQHQQQQSTQVQVQKTTIMVVDGNSDDQSTKQTMRTNQHQIVANKNYEPKQQQHEQQKYQLHRPQKSNKPSKQQFLHSMPINNSNYSNRKITANVGVGGNDSGMSTGASTPTGRTHTAQASLSLVNKFYHFVSSLHCYGLLLEPTAHYCFANNNLIINFVIKYYVCRQQIKLKYEVSP